MLQVELESSNDSVGLDMIAASSSSVEERRNASVEMEMEGRSIFDEDGDVANEMNRRVDSSYEENITKWFKKERSLLGKGPSGEVYEAFNNDTQSSMVVKEFVWETRYKIRSFIMEHFKTIIYLQYG